MVLIGSTDGQQSDPIGVPILAFKLRNPKNDKWNENFSFVKVRCSYKNLITFSKGTLEEKMNGDISKCNLKSKVKIRNEQAEEMKGGN